MCHADWHPVQEQPSERISRVLLSVGITSFSVKPGNNLTVAFQARSGVIITGGSSKLGFMDDPVSCRHSSCMSVSTYCIMLYQKECPVLASHLSSN